MPPSTGTDSGAVVEDTTLQTSGQLSVTDADAGQAAFVAQSTTGSHGSFSIDASGAWSYTLNNADPAVQALAQGQSLAPEQFTVTTLDGTSTVVTVSITGSSGGNFEALTATGSAVTTVSDDGDVSTLTLSASAASVAEGGSVVYTASVSAPVVGAPLVKKRRFVRMPV